MASDQEKFDKQERASRLKKARLHAKISGPKGVYDASNGEVDVNLYKGHESGRNGYSVSEARRYADLFGVPLTWLYLGIGNLHDVELPGASAALKQAFAKLVDAPETVHDQVISFIGYQLGLAADVRPPPDQIDDRYESPSRRRVSTPSR